MHASRWALPLPFVFALSLSFVVPSCLGQIDFDEFLAVMKSREVKEENELKQAFDVFDKVTRPGERTRRQRMSEASQRQRWGRSWSRRCADDLFCSLVLALIEDGDGTISAKVSPDLSSHEDQRTPLQRPSQPRRGSHVGGHARFHLRRSNFHSCADLLYPSARSSRS